MAGGPSERDQVWWFDGAIWWPRESADGRQRFTGGRWVPKRRAVRVLQVLSWLWLAVSPIALFVGFGAVAGHPQYVDGPPLPDSTVSAFLVIGLLWAPVGVRQRPRTINW